MRRSTLVPVAALLVLSATFSVPLAAQQVPEASGSAETVLRTEIVPRNPPTPVQNERTSAVSLRKRAGQMVAGAVLGGWLGYFASQIAVSDWEAETDSSLGTYRGTWAAAGVFSGAVVGRLLNPGATRQGAEIDMTRGRAILSRDEIVRSGASTAYDLIRSQRAEWLQPRGVNSFTETTRGRADHSDTVIIPGEDRVLVYLDNARIGGTQHLAELPLSDVRGIEFIEGPQATLRWGAGHAHGVIQISTFDTSGR